MSNLPKLDVVIANNFGHLPMFIGAEKGYFKQHGVDASFKVVDTGTDMVNALHDGLAHSGRSRQPRIPPLRRTLARFRRQPVQSPIAP